MRKTLGLTAGFFLAAASAQAAPLATAYKISMQGGFYVGFHGAIAIRRVAEGPGAVWVAERRYRETQGPDGVTTSFKHDWIDGRTCPALASVVASIPRLPRPSPGNANPVIHGLRVSVTALRDDKALYRTNDFDGPVTRWWSTTDAALKPCWRDDPVSVAGQTMAPLLATDADERAFTPLPSAW